MKIPITLNEILSADNIEAAIEHLMTKKDTCGPDGIHLHSLSAYWEDNQQALRESLLEGSFRPGLVRKVEILNERGKKREIISMNAIDRLLLRCIVQMCSPAADPQFNELSFAFQTGKGVKAAVNKAKEYIQSGREWVAETDIRDYFDSVSLNRLNEIIDDVFPDEALKVLISKYLTPDVESDFEIAKPVRGLLQGSPLSPLLSNLYLHELDNVLSSMNMSFVRYCDDINIYVKSYEDGVNKLAFLKKRLRADYDLEINAEKSGVFNVFNRTFLGHVFFPGENGRIYSHKQKKNRLEVYSRWHPTNIQKLDGNYHIVNDGILTRKDYTLLFENEDKKYHIPVEATKSINIYSNIALTGELLKYMSEHGITVTIFDRHGDFAGRFSGPGSVGPGSTMMKQAAIYLNAERRLKVARSIITAAVHNMRANTRYYKKQRKDHIFTEIEDALSASLDELNSAGSVEQLMLIEARARQAYYKLFAALMASSDFAFDKRTKRPPRDAINALISFGNTVLYNRIASEIHKSRLDIRVGYLHSTTSRRQSLNLDLAEIYKPIIVDRVIFTAVNKGILDPHLHFEKVDKDAVYMNAEGKQIFLRMLEQKLYQKVNVKGRRLTYDTVMKYEVLNLQKHIEKGEKYKPYKYY